VVAELSQDLRYAWRALRARRGFTLVVVLTVALGVGANTAIFSAVNALLLRSLPVKDVDRLVFGMALREGFDPFGTSLLEYALYREEGRSFESLGLGTPRLFALLESGEPERVRGAAVTASYLSTVGVRPARGRLFLEEEDRPGGPAVVLLGHELWQRRFGGEEAVIGRALLLEGRSYTVVGILPPGFDLPYSAEAWVPMQVSPDSLPLDQRAATANELVARLRPGIGLGEADTELKGLARRLEREYPQIRRGWSYGIVPLRSQLLADLEGRTQRLLVALVVAVAFLLLICCANVANLLLARGVAREGEIAVRLSLGAGRARLVRQMLTESLLLACLGGALGLLLAFWMQPLLVALNPIQPVGLGAYLTDFRIDARVLSFSLAVTLLTGGIFGLAPALKAARSDGLIAALKRERRGGTGRAAGRSLGALVVGEVAIAAALLVGGGLMLRSFDRLRRSDLGFRPERLLTLELPLTSPRYVGLTQQVQFMEQVLERARALPGVVAAGMTLNVPLQRGVVLDSVFEVEGRPRTKESDVPITSHRLVSPGYLETLGVRLVKGRLLDERDREGSLPVAVVSDELVRQAWPGEDPLGKRVRRIRAGERGPWMTVVGVVKDVKEDRFSFRISRPVWYLPYAQQTFPVPVSLPLNLVVRAAGDPSGLAAPVREAVRAVDPHQPVAGVMPMQEYLSDVLIAERFSAVLMGTLAGLGLLLAALGLYGVMAYSVSQRTGEIGLRVALGARPRDILGLVLRAGVSLVGLGLGLGVAGAWALTRLLSSALHEVGPDDPATFALVTVFLAAVALVACWLPARRATRLSPVAALRSE
jgi:putative ABC transport system permease protein